MVMPTRVCVFLSFILAAQAISRDGLQPSKEKGLFLQQDLQEVPKYGISNETDKPKALGIKVKDLNPFDAGHHHPSDRLKCGVTEQVGSETDKYEDCPADCGYFAQNRKDTEHCTFLCVPGDECETWNPKKPIPDTIKNSKTCRGPKVAFCSEPTLDGKDTCAVCQTGYSLHHDDGQCYFEQWTLIISIGAVFGVIALIVVAWVVDLCLREPINADTVTKMEEWRSRSKILCCAEGPDDARQVYPIGTNLCTYPSGEDGTRQSPVGGPGMMLHFRFQLFFIVWSLCLGLVWTLIACFHNELFTLGTKKFGTPRHNCILVAWGYETQQRLMWTKVLFLLIAYIASFVSFVAFSISQLRAFQNISNHEVGMSDVAVEIKGLPALPCSNLNVEKDLKAAIKLATGLDAVGISVAWNYTEKQDTVNTACWEDLAAKERAVALAKKETPHAENYADEDECTKDMNAMHKWMYKKEKAILGPDPEDEEDVKAMLEGLTSSSTAFAVFNTPQDAKKCTDMNKEIEFDATKYGKDFEKAVLTMEKVSNEPVNINWHNFDHSDSSQLMKKFIKGFFKFYVPALLIWFFCFYVPYAASLYYFNYDNGAELPGYFSLIFTIIVCGGNATMYVVCDLCCDECGFRYKDTKQVTYMLMYLVACMINVFLDMYVTYLTARKIMIGQDFRTYHGERLADIGTYTEQFETYAMQRSLGENVYRYAWPSTFFLCFVLEPFVTIIVPYLIGRVIVRTHREIQGACAEAYMMAFEFDTGRYADILLNVFLGILIFYFPGGYIWTLFFAMSFSHCFIYSFDHWRVLKVIPFVKIVSMQVDWWAQLTMGFCCSIILSCLIFKANCESYAGYCMQGSPLLVTCSIAAFVHFIVHSALLIFVVPKFGVDPKDLGSEEWSHADYAFIATKEPRTWFSVNPVHCLRSQLQHGDSPHCRLATFGKEHFLEANPKINCYFKAPPAKTEDYHDMRKSFSQSFKQ